MAVFSVHQPSPTARSRHGCVLNVHQPSPTVQVADMAVCSVFISRHQPCTWQTWLCAQCSSAVTNRARGRHGCVLCSSAVTNRARGRHGCVFSVHQPSPTVHVVDMAVCSVSTSRHLPCRCRRHLYRRTVCRMEWSCGTAARTPRC